MFKRNESNLDRALRVALGIALLIAFFMSDKTGLSWLYLLGLIPLITGLVGTCPLYTIFGISTCPKT